MRHLSNWKAFNEGLALDIFQRQFSDVLDLFQKDADEIMDIKYDSSPISGTVSTQNLTGDKKQAVDLLKKYMEKYGMSNPYLQVAILGTIGKECDFVPKNEYSYSKTSNNRLRDLFGKRLAGLNDAELESLKKSDELFYDRIYGGRYGNNAQGDGYKYRGRGFNGITFKDLYEKMQKLLSAAGTNVDIVTNPDKLNDPDVAANAAILYFKNALADSSLYQKFGIKDPNQFKDQETAIKAVVNANAGWGNQISASNPNLVKAKKYASAFSINTGGEVNLA